MPQTGIVNYKEVAKSYASNVVKRGGRLIFDFEADSFNHLPDGGIQSNNLLPLSLFAFIGYCLVSR